MSFNLKAINGSLFFSVILFSAPSSFSTTLSGLQQCQTIKNSAKKSECYDKQTQLIIQEDNDRKQKEKIAQIEAEKLALEVEKKALEDKKLAEEKVKIDKAQKILQTLKRLQTRVETGVSYRDYSSLISDPKFEVRSYISDNPNDFPEFARHILKSIAYYDAAGAIWSLKFKNETGRLSEITCSPQAMNIVTNMLDGAYIRRSVTLTCGEGLLISDAVSTAWIKASESIREASNTLIAK